MTNRVAEYFEWVLYAVGAVLLSIAAGRMFRYEAFQLHPQWFAAKARPDVRGSSAFNRRASYQQQNPIPGALQIVGRVEIPRLSLALNVVEGDDDNSLALSAGHVPGSSPIGGTGNAVIAGHRDTSFRPLRNIRSGDLIRAYRSGEAYQYQVESTRIVKPDDLSVLRPGTGPTLTLITCYPFRYVGDAPDRFIVTARMIAH